MILCPDIDSKSSLALLGTSEERALVIKSPTGSPCAAMQVHGGLLLRALLACTGSCLDRSPFSFRLISFRTDSFLTVTGVLPQERGDLPSKLQRRLHPVLHMHLTYLVRLPSLARNSKGRFEEIPTTLR